MSFYALENLDEALEETKDLLLPFDLVTWTKIAIIAVLASGVSLPNLPTGAPPQSGGGDLYTPDSGIQSTPDVASGLGDISMTGLSTAGMTDAVVVAIVIVALLAGGFLMYISSLFEFIYYQTVLDKKPVIIENIRKHAVRGLRYLGFNIGIFLLVIGTLILSALAFEAGAALGLAAVFLGWAPFVLLIAIFSVLVKDLALLRMMEHNEGLIKAWRNVWPDIKGEWKQVVVYLLVKLGIGLGISFATIFIMIFTLILVGIPFVLIAVITGMIFPPLVLLVVIAGFLTFTILMAYINMPFSAFMRTYITLFYHDLTS